jgi:hypothetical protein
LKSPQVSELPKRAPAPGAVTEAEVSTVCSRSPPIEYENDDRAGAADVAHGLAGNAGGDVAGPVSVEVAGHAGAGGGVGAPIGDLDISGALGPGRHALQGGDQEGDAPERRETTT